MYHCLSGFSCIIQGGLYVDRSRCVRKYIVAIAKKQRGFSDDAMCPTCQTSNLWWLLIQQDANADIVNNVLQWLGKELIDAKHAGHDHARLQPLSR